MPRWVQQKLNDVDAELEGERAKRETAEAHEKTLRAQISKEAKVQQNLKGERDRALTEIGELKGAVEERDKALQAQIAKQTETEQVLKSKRESALAEAANFKTVLQDRDTLKEQTAKQADTEQGLKTERDRALADVAKLNATVEGLSRAPLDTETRWAKVPTKRWLAPIAVGIALLAAVLGGTLVSMWRGERSDAGVDTKVAELTATVTKSDKARQDAEAKANQAAAALAKSDTARQDAEAKAVQAAAALTKSEQARQAAEAKAADAEKARQAAAARADDADKARLAAFARAEDADRARRAAEAKAADADKARQAAEAKLALPQQAEQTGPPGAAEANATFTIKSNVTVTGQFIGTAYSNSTHECQQRCEETSHCRAFTFRPDSPYTGADPQRCSLYSTFTRTNPLQDFISGWR
jgi:chemotaxis protein MotB